jgi:type II secretory pathway pseudopilin PulG
MTITHRQQVINERGVTYLMLMFAIVLIGIATTAAAKQWKTTVQRELEIDLLAKGIEIQNALAFYSAANKAGRVMPGEVYPQTLADLTKLPKPFLRKVYLDPIGRGEWEYIRAPTGGIMGVRSTSRAKPFRQRNFPLAVRHFEGRPTYRDWIFQHPSPSSAPIVPQEVIPLSVTPPMEEPAFVPNGGELDGSASVDPPIAGAQPITP